MARNTSRSSSTKTSTKQAGPAKKSSTKRAASKRSPAKKTSGETYTSDDTSDDTTSDAGSTKATTKRPSRTRDSDGRSSSGRSAPKAPARPPARASQIAAAAALELLELTGRQVEGVTGLQKTEDGWTVQVEVVEVRRIPDTTDVLALYDVETDSHGAMLGYQRVRRYARGTPGSD